MNSRIVVMSFAFWGGVGILNTATTLIKKRRIKIEDNVSIGKPNHIIPIEEVWYRKYRYYISLVNVLSISSSLVLVSSGARKLEHNF